MFAEDENILYGRRFLQIYEKKIYSGQQPGAMRDLKNRKYYCVLKLLDFEVMAIRMKILFFFSGYKCQKYYYDG